MPGFLRDSVGGVSAAKIAQDTPVATVRPRGERRNMILARDGTPIGDLTTWQRLGGPKRSIQWKDGRSAKELARTWLSVESPALPPEVAAALTSHPDFGPIERWTATPEARVAFDDVPGEVRNTDLLVDAQDTNGRFILSVEAKADEPFGDTVAETLGDAAERTLNNPRSGALRRVRQLLAALLPPQPKIAPGQPAPEKYAKAGSLRYQLLTGAAGAISAAVKAGCERAVFLVQQFESVETDPARVARNAAALDGFMHRVSSGRVSSVDSGSVYGPLAVPGLPLFSGRLPVLYVGKVVRYVVVPGA